MEPTTALADHDQIVLAITALASMLAASLVYLVKGYGNIKTAATEAKAANAAVNGVGPEHRLWDKVNRIEQSVDRLVSFQTDFERHGWGNFPPDIDDAVSLTGTLREMRHDIDQIRALLTEHVQWEMSVKYPLPE